ncbi:MAG: hypothetical protein OXB95_02225 [Rhodobacteraceae bacterium]|nr:hypothetical protein [Paracoccaceae bacterium]
MGRPTFAAGSGGNARGRKRPLEDHMPLAAGKGREDNPSWFGDALIAVDAVQFALPPGANPLLHPIPGA